jgi:S-formylglutathione hydrolase FrmB
MEVGKPLAVWVLLGTLAITPADQAAAQDTAPQVVVHELNSEFQPAPVQIRVLQPRSLRGKGRLPVVYVLPVESGNENRYGDGLLEAQQHDLAERLGVIFVLPTFAQLPWYADHPTNTEIRQESHLLKCVVPFVEQHYPARTDADGRLLVGFSKSGWGAWALLLRNPDVFGRAAAWDAPLQMSEPGRYGSAPIFSTVENFRAYQISRLLVHGAAQLQAEPARLILLGYGGFRDDHVQTHEQLIRLGIVHVYRDGPQRKHDWHSGWFCEACDFLLAEQHQ